VATSVSVRRVSITIRKRWNVTVQTASSSNKPIMISITELMDYMRCHRAHDFTSPNRQGLVKRGMPQIQFHVGSAVHYGVSAPVFGEEPLPAVAHYLEEEHRRIAVGYAEQVGAPMGSAELTSLEESRVLATSMVEHYFATYGANPIHPYRYLTAEMSFRIPLPQIGPNVFLVGTMDGVAVDFQGRIYLVERKTASQKSDAKWLPTDPQLNGYVWALQALTGEKVAGILYDVLLKKLPKTPRLLQSGLLSQEWTDTTATRYEQALSEHYGENWKEVPIRTAQGRVPLPALEVYGGFIERLKERDRITDLWNYETPFFTRRYVDVIQHGVRQWGQDMIEVVDEMVHRPSNYPNFSWTGCYDCWVPDLCRAKQFGQDLDYVIKTNYVTSDHRPQYKAMVTVTPETVSSVDDLRALFERRPEISAETPA
jgi:hypothetical protein